MNNLLAWIGGLFAVVLAALFTVPYFIDWNGYRGTFEEEASRILGREVRVGGEVSVRILPAPYVSFDRLRIADTAEDAGEPLFRAESFKMWLSVPPLLRGVLEARQVEVEKPILNLATTPEGGGNWQTLALSPGGLPFVPADVALQSVRLSNGVVGVRTAAGAELARLEHIDGELAAEALEGPFKFRGSLTWNEERRDVHVATARMEPTGDMRFKASIRASATGNTYLLDGKIGGLGGRTTVSGDLTAKLAFALKAEGEPAAATQGPPSEAAAKTEATDEGGLAMVSVLDKNGAVRLPDHDSSEPAFDVRAHLEGNAQGFELTDIQMNFDQGGPPQLVTGRARMAWSQSPHLDLEINSKWLDLDRLAGAGSGAMPFESVRSLFVALAGALPVAADTNAALRFDQITLGGESMSDVRLTAIRAGGPLELKDMSAGLPGGARLALDGVLAVDKQSPKLTGELAVSGQSLMRFLAWGLKDPTVRDGRSDGEFSLRGTLSLSESVFELTSVTADFGGSPFAGELKLGLGERLRLAVSLEGHKIDWRQFWPAGFGLASLRSMDGGGAAAESPEGSPPAPTGTGTRRLDLAQADISLRLRAGTLVDGDRVLKDVDANISVQRGTLRVPRMKFVTAAGLDVDLEGEAEGVPGRPRGTLRGVVAAPSREAVADALQLLDAAEIDGALSARAGHLAPLRLAGTLGFGVRTQTAADLTLDGVARGGRLVATVRLDGGTAAWRSSGFDATVTAENEDVADLLALLTGASTGRTTTPIAPRPGRLTLRTAGTPSRGMLAVGAIEGDGLVLKFDGRAVLAEGAPPKLDGEMQVAARNASEVLALAGLQAGRAVGAYALDGLVAIEADGDRLSLAPRQLAINGSRVSGTLTLTRSATGPSALVADLDVDQASVPALLSVILDRGGLSATADGVTSETDTGAVAAEAGVWPDQPFDLSATEAVEGRVTARFGSLALEPGLSASNVRLEAALAPGRVTVGALEGDALGGKVAANLTLVKEQSGIAAKGGLRFTIAGTRAQESAGQQGAPPEAVSFVLDYQGRALSPAALIADMRGKGELMLADVALSGMAPDAVGSIAASALEGKGPSSGEPLVEALRGTLKQGELKLGSVRIPVEIGDGAMRLAEVKLDQPAGRTTFITTIELATLKIDSEWKIAASVPSRGAPGGKLLPPVSVIYVGKLKDIATLAPQISAAAYERELAVRKMERDVDELERLRKLDEIQAKKEEARRKAAEEARRKALELERQKALPPPAGDGAGAAEPQPGDGGGADPNPPPADGGAPPAAEPAADAAGAGDPAAQAEAAAADSAVGPDGMPIETVPPPKRVLRKPRPAAESWKPFQITPY